MADKGVPTPSFIGLYPNDRRGSLATPSMARGGHRTPFPFLSKTDAHSDCWRGPRPQGFTPTIEGVRWPRLFRFCQKRMLIQIGLYPNDRRGGLRNPKK